MEVRQYVSILLYELGATIPSHFKVKQISALLMWEPLSLKGQVLTKEGSAGMTNRTKDNMTMS